MKTSQILSLAVAGTLALAFGPAALSAHFDGTTEVTARVLDLNNTGDQRVMVSMHNEPFLLQYSHYANDTTEFCVVPESPQAPRTCYRAKNFDAGSNGSQRLKFVWMDPSIYEN